MNLRGSSCAALRATFDERREGRIEHGRESWMEGVVRSFEIYVVLSYQLMTVLENV